MSRLYLDGGDDPDFKDVDDFLRSGFAAHAVYDSDTNKAAIEVIDQHIPSLTDEDEVTIVDAIAVWTGEVGEGGVDIADFALRTCHCGVKVDGFYEYVDHLKAMLRAAGVP